MDSRFLGLGTSWRRVVGFTALPLYHRGKETTVPISWEVGWSPEPVWTIWRSYNSLPYRDSNSDLSVVHPVASRYTDYATKAHVN
jgi:hypothetical protein